MLGMIEALQIARKFWPYLLMAIGFCYVLFGLGQILEVYRVLADQILLQSDFLRNISRLVFSFICLFCLSYALYIASYKQLQLVALPGGWPKWTYNAIATGIA